MSKEAMKLALEAAYLAGWNASGEGYNAEYPFGDHARNPEEDAAWIKDRDNALREALAEQPAQTVLASAQIVSLNDMQGVVDWLPHNGATLKAGDYLYTSPPAQPAQRTWVGLTDEERNECTQTPFTADQHRAIEAKLKEKNT